jgi:hypothetical protein
LPKINDSFKNNFEGKINMTGHVDNIFTKISGFIGGTVQRFAAFLFILIAFGALYGAFAVTIDPLLLFIPGLLAMLAYYNRTFATIALIGFILFIFL